MRISEYDYELPHELIAQTPLRNRDQSRLLVLDRRSGNIEHDIFENIGSYLQRGDLIVLNNTRVTARRIFCKKFSGAKIELLILKNDNGCVKALAKPAKRLKSGDKVLFDALTGTVIEELDGGVRVIQFENANHFSKALLQNGRIPLPPYIGRELEVEERYQTVFSVKPGSAAAPTAGLHFTNDLIAKLKNQGIDFAFVNLCVGIDTFRPVSSDNIVDHKMHGEEFEIEAADAEKINSASGKIVAIGTTTVRALESASIGPRRVKAMKGRTEIFITPGYEFKVVDAMVTNFHLPKTTMLLMVSALASRDKVMNAYQDAIESKYRFLSFGDSMLIIGRK